MHHFNAFNALMRLMHLKMQIGYFTLTYQIVLIDMKRWEIWPYKIPHYWALKVVLP